MWNWHELRVMICVECDVMLISGQWDIVNVDATLVALGQGWSVESCM